MGAAAMAMLSLAACSNNGSCNGSTCKDNDKDMVYTGVMPAADCDGVRYTLTLDYDDDAKDGDYKLVETYIQADTTSMIGYKDLNSFASEGDFTVNKQGDKTYLKLVKDQKDSSANSVDGPLYFIVDSDSTITMANAELETSTTPGMNYTLKLAK